MTFYFEKMLFISIQNCAGFLNSSQRRIERGGNGVFKAHRRGAKNAEGKESSY